MGKMEFLVMSVLYTSILTQSNSKIYADMVCVGTEFTDSQWIFERCNRETRDRI